MVIYNPKAWFGLIFKFHQADTFRKLFWVLIGLAVFSGAVAYVEIEIRDLQYKGTPLVHSLLGFIISLLLVFRTNTAYDRWWEGRKQWGALVNVSRNFALKINAFIPITEEKRRQRMREQTALYASVLRHHLRNMDNAELLQTLPENLQGELPADGHIPNHLAAQMQGGLLEAYQKKEISEAAYLAMLTDLNAFSDICGACERIKKTPIPYTYNLFIKKFIFAYIITMPFALVGTLGYGCIGVTVFTFYALASLEMIAEEIEDPFGTDSNDLPTDDLALTIERNVKTLIKA